MSSQSLSIGQVLSLLRKTPPHIAVLIADLEPAQLHTAPGQGEWSANDVLAHLRSCADVWGGCIAVIITQDMPTIRALSPRTWIRKTNYLEQEFQPSLQVFVAQRSALLAVLEPLAEEGWLRAATVTKAGKVLERTVFSYAQLLAHHEQLHLEQLKCLVHTMRQ